jgi:predicted O-methyltransferase YrrM
MTLISTILSRAVKMARLRTLLTKIFILFQKLGFNLTPNHYYQPIPDLSSLREDIWQKSSEMVGVDLNENRQLSLLEEFCAKYKTEFDNLYSGADMLNYKGRMLGPVDCEILYSMVRYFRPQRMIEIGSGDSTLISAKALLLNKKESGISCEFNAIEPYPPKFLKNPLPGLNRLLEKRLEDIPLDMFTDLEENDILFIDSSHVLKIGGDVKYEYLEILPRLKRGVVVHIHDIFLPLEYPKKWVYELFRFWNEQYLLQAFLAFNRDFEVLWGGSFMHLKHSEKLQSAFKTYNPKANHPGSFWIRKI